MICPHCHKLVPDGMLACVNCTVKRSQEALRGYQLEALRRCMGKPDAYFITRYMNGLRHVVMFGAEMTHCGLHILGGSRKQYLPVGDLRAGYVCPACRDELLDLIEKAGLCPSS